MVLRERFSASKFWQDIVGERCTLFQYIGELCRYLLNAAPRPEETQHQLRLCCGNGLRAEVWEPFQERFRIPQILEYYASTEGNFSLYNCEGGPGAIGRIPPFLSHRMPVALVQLRRRRRTRRCAMPPDTACAARPNEVGEAIGQILRRASGSGALRGLCGRGGHRAEGAAQRVRAGRCLVPHRRSDAPGRAGILLLRRPHRRHLSLEGRERVDHRGRGRHRRLPGVIDAAVYGVTVPGTDGRAGMAALTVSGASTCGAAPALAAALPAYARPLFVRIVAALELTGTFKLRKQELALEGYDPARIADPLYFDDAAAGAYRPLDAALHQRLVAGELRL